MQKQIKIGTRASLLAMTQSTNIKNLIEKQYPGTTVELVKIITKGDKILDVPLAKVGGKGLFVKELEEAMLSREVDMAVHVGVHAEEPEQPQPMQIQPPMQTIARPANPGGQISNGHGKRGN